MYLTSVSHKCISHVYLTRLCNMEESKTPEDFHVNIRNDLRQCLYLMSIPKQFIYKIKRDSFILRKERVIVHIRIKDIVGSDSKIIVNVLSNGKKNGTHECFTYEEVVNKVKANMKY